jgi:two-component system chemotaxis response regulator CheY
MPAFKIEDCEAGLNNLSEHFCIPPKKLKEKAKTVEAILLLQNLGKKGDLKSLVFANLLDCLRNERKVQSQNHFISRLNLLKELNPDGKKVLIVDDSLYVHYYLASYFTELGYRIVNFARNGLDGVSLYHFLKPDIVTLDLTMPVMSGIEAAKRIYEKDKNANIIFITALGKDKQLIKNIQGILPGLDFNVLVKPMKQKELESVLNKMAL